MSIDTKRTLHRGAFAVMPLVAWGLFACSGDASADSATTRAAAAASTTTAAGPGGPHFTPPPEVVAACANLSAGASCTVSRPGTCTAVGTDVACEPAPPAPPAEAVTACASASAGDACTVTFGNHTMSGTCKSRDGGPLACAPAHPGHHDHPMPPEAAQACASSSAGAACSITIRDGKTLSGTCVADDAGTLGCRPARHTPPEAVSACSGLKAGDACTVSMTSTCHALLDGTMACMPAHGMHGPGGHGGPGGPGPGPGGF